MYPIEINTWYNCVPDRKKPDQLELCKICRMHDERYHYHWHIVTYYNGTDVFGGELNDCLHWINSHYVNRRYLDHGQE